MNWVYRTAGNRAAWLEACESTTIRRPRQRKDYIYDADTTTKILEIIYLMYIFYRKDREIAYGRAGSTDTFFVAVGDRSYNVPLNWILS